jgi:phosphatidylglycerophosphate synthase
MSDTHRRPIASRDTRWAGRLASWLVARRASANGISVAGMLAGLAAGACLAATSGVPVAWPLWLLAALFIQLRLLANLLDGMVAIGRGVASPTGELFNELPDRVSDTAVLMGLGWAAAQPALGIAAALAAMATAYVRAVGKGLGQASDFAGPMAKQQRMAVVTAVAVVCAVLPVAWRTELTWAALWIILVLSLATALRRLLRLVRALRA